MAALQSAREGKTARFTGAANTAKGTPKFWEVEVRRFSEADGKPSQLLSISRDITAENEAVERQRFLMRELEHRVKNTLSIILAIASRTFQGEVHRAARETFIGRVMNRNQANEILKELHWTETPVRRIVEGTLVQHPQMREGITTKGPNIDLNPKQALALALALNELGTNALKYGALSVPAGRI